MILHIESATKNCSIALGDQGKLVAQKELLSENFRHSELLHTFIKELLENISLDYNQLHAIAVSRGPGSFTGLRIGVATAKAMCYSLGIPLISINSLESMAHKIELEEGQIVISLLDARNNRVYALGLDQNKQVIKKTWIERINRDSFEDLKNEKTFVVVGNGQLKLKELLPGFPCQYVPQVQFPSAIDMLEISFKKYKSRQFEDIMEFEPSYFNSFFNRNNA